MRSFERILPVQPFNTNEYREPIENYYRLLDQVISSSCQLKPITEQFKIEVSDKAPLDEMASTPAMLRLLETLVKLTNAKRILEIGTFLGVSAMTMAKVSERVVTIEKFSHFAAIAKRNFVRNGLDSKITLIEGDAATISLPDKPFDLIFVDGNKERYSDYFLMLAPLLRSGGLIVFDDCLFHGDVLNNPPRTEKGKGVKAMLDLAQTLKDWTRLVLPVGNGVLLMVKPSSIK